MSAIPSHASRAATVLGIGALLLWAALASLTVATGQIPPFQMNAMTFAIGGLAGLIVVIRRGNFARALKQPLRAWMLGIAGLFGYHALYFASLRLAPPAEATLFNYLWPLLIVLFASLLPGERLTIRHLGGAALGFAGLVLLVAGKGGVAFSGGATLGYGLALLAAFIWAGYSVLSRRMGGVPTDTVAFFCLATAFLSFVCHLIFETTVPPPGLVGWLVVAALGAGPVGAAFYLWDVGMKRGDIKLLGVLSYAVPVVSTLLLVGLGYTEASWSLFTACLLIAFGAGIASFGKRGKPT